MTRSGYSDDYDGAELNLYRANVDRAIAGKRGQAFLREMAAALDAMPVKELVAEEIVRDSEHVCAIGSVALARKLDVSGLDVADAERVARTMGIAECLAREIAYENDECGQRYEEVAPAPPGEPIQLLSGGPPRRRWRSETPAERWTRMRAWVAERLR